MCQYDIMANVGPVLLLLALCMPARAYEVQHPVFPVEVPEGEVAQLKGQVAPVMEFNREKIEEFIVPRTTFYNVDCPNCEGGNVSRSDRWIWSVDDPDHIECKFCGMVFPSEKYPLDEITTVTDSTGTVQTYRYWEGPNGYKYYMQMRVENCKKVYMEQSVGRLARLHAATEDESCARQAVLILCRLADVYPHYSPHGIESWSTMAPQIHDIRLLPRPEDGRQPVPGLAKDLKGYKTPYPYCSGMRADGGDNWFYAEMPPHLVYAYDLVANSAEFDRLSEELGEDVRQHIEEFFRATANYARTFPIYLGNMDPSLIRGLAVIGRVIGEPEFVHDALRRVKLILGWQFYPDGIWREGSPSYHSQTVNGLRSCMEGPLKGYSDPEGYVNPEDGLHISDLDVARDVPMLQESMDALNRMRMPNGHYITVHDTWAQSSHGRAVGEVRDGPFETTLMWGLGQAIVGLGEGKTGVQANLHFSGSYGHAHADNLDLMLFGQGRELLSDVGYTHTVLRPFSVTSMAHNLVVVDELAQRGADGHLMAWMVGEDLLRFCEAGAEAAYPNLVSQYRRALALVKLPQVGAYVVDVFRVKGGSKHDWHIHGSADFDQTLSCSVPLEDLEGSLLPPGVEFDRSAVSGQGWQTVVDGVNLLYGLFDELRAGPGDQTWSVTFNYTEPDTPALRTTVLGQPDTTVYCGTLPSIRRARESNEHVWDYQMPAVMARRQGGDLESVFAAVHEPHKGAPQLTSIERLKLAEGEPDAVGIICKGDGFCDYHLCGTDAASELKAVDVPVEATARYAFVRTQNGQPVKMVLVDGSEIRFGETSLRLSEAPSGNVVGVRRIEAGDDENALIVDAQIAPRKGNPHERVIVEFGNGFSYGLAVQEIREEGGRSAIVLTHRPGFELSEDGQSAEQTYHPHHNMPGQPRFRLPNVAIWQRQ